MFAIVAAGRELSGGGAFWLLLHPKRETMQIVTHASRIIGRAFMIEFLR
jgi:hypothetical protein